jgi:hypothetical protein
MGIVCDIVGLSTVFSDRLLGSKITTYLNLAPISGKKMQG